MAGRIPLAFFAGFASFIAPCVLPLVPGYRRDGRRAASSPRRARRHERAVRRGLHRSSSSRSGSRSRAASGVVEPARVRGDRRLRARRLRARLRASAAAAGAAGRARLLAAARGRGSRVLLGAAFATCAAPCVSPILASTLVLAADRSTVGEGALLLFAYSLGLAVPFVAHRRRVRPGDGVVPLAPRPLPLHRGRRRDRSSSSSGCCSSSESSGGCAPASATSV